MRVSDASFYNRFLDGFRKGRSDLSRAVEQLADGKRVRFASDDPVGAHASLELRGNVVRLEGYLRSASRARFDLATMDEVLGEAVTLVTKARDEAMAGASGVQRDVNAIRAQDIDDLRERLLDLANTNQNGRQLFSGTETLTASFDAAGTYLGDDFEAQAPIAVDQQVGSTLSGRRVFQGAAGDLFQLLDDVATALRADDTAALQTQIPQLTVHLDHLAEIHAEVGLRMERIDEVVGRQEDRLVRLRSRIGQIEDAVLERTALDLAAAETQIQALSATAARVLSRSLFDFFA